MDCMNEDGGQELCEKFEVRGYPTIKYFVDGDMEKKDYQGGRDFDSLKSHVSDNLEVKCDANNPDEEACSEKEMKYVTKTKDKTSEERTKQLERLDKMKDESTKPELKQWLMQRLRIPKALESDGKEEEEEEEEEEL